MLDALENLVINPEAAKQYFGEDFIPDLLGRLQEFKDNFLLSFEYPRFQDMNDEELYAMFDRKADIVLRKIRLFAEEMPDLSYRQVCLDDLSVATHILQLLLLNGEYFFRCATTLIDKREDINKEYLTKFSEAFSLLTIAVNKFEEIYKGQAKKSDQQTISLFSHLITSNQEDLEKAIERGNTKEDLLRRFDDWVKTTNSVGLLSLSVMPYLQIMFERCIQCHNDENWNVRAFVKQFSKAKEKYKDYIEEKMQFMDFALGSNPSQKQLEKVENDILRELLQPKSLEMLFTCILNLKNPAQLVKRLRSKQISEDLLDEIFKHLLIITSLNEKYHVLDEPRDTTGDPIAQNSVPLENLPAKVQCFILCAEKWAPYCDALKKQIKPFIDSQGNKALWDVVSFYSKLYNFVDRNTSRNMMAQLFVSIIPELGSESSLEASMAKCALTSKEKLKRYKTLASTDHLKAYESSIGMAIKKALS